MANNVASVGTGLTNLHFHEILHHSKTVVPKLRIRQNLLTERIFNVSNPWNSKHRSRALSKSTTVEHGAYAVDTLKVEIEAVKSRWGLQ